MEKELAGLCNTALTLAASRCIVSRVCNSGYSFRMPIFLLWILLKHCFGTPCFVLEADASPACLPSSSPLVAI
ncbi:hypothetical protein TYRP_011886 [Tyrophagus putrescentiae]|nr:hypothetical protein TYRP_011886 [Tyrophagus putrescentiae]